MQLLYARRAWQASLEMQGMRLQSSVGSCCLVPASPARTKRLPSGVTFSLDANQQHRSIQCSEPRVLPGFQTIRVHAPTPSGFKSPSPLFPTCFCWGCRDRDPNRGVRHPPRLHGVRCRLAEFRSAPWWRGGEVQSRRGLAVRSVGRSRCCF